MAVQQPLKRRWFIPKRQWQAALLLVEGMSNKEIASAMNIELRTVKSYVAKLCDRLQCRNDCKRVQCAVKIYRFLLNREQSGLIAIPSA